MGAFVNAADEHDVPAFQSCGFFGLQPQAGAIHGRSDAAAKDVVPARQHGGAPCARVARRKGRAPTVSVSFFFGMCLGIIQLVYGKLCVCYYTCVCVFFMFFSSVILSCLAVFF